MVFHSPKHPINNAPWTKEQVVNGEPTFFLSESHVDFVHGRDLYWFSDDADVALSNSDYFKDGTGTKWRLVLKCLIPEHSECNYCKVKAEDVKVLELIWQR
jgi:hypothetical protein